MAFALLVAGILSDKLWPMEFLHVVFGSAWTIIDLFLGLVLGPILGSLAPAARIEHLVKRLHRDGGVLGVLGNLLALSRVDGFAWQTFAGVARWALRAYALTTGLIEFSFLHNHLRGGALVVLTLSLIVYAVHVPMLIGFTVARYAAA